MSGKSKFQISRSLDERIKRIILGSNEHDSDFAEVSSAYILGFNYGNVTNCVGLTTNYQLHHAVFPVVGLVFFKTSPVDDDIKSILKSITEFSSSPNGLGSFKSDKNEHLFLIYNVDHQSKEVEKRIFNITKGKFVRRRRLRLNILDDPFCPRQVHEGSEDLFNLGDGDSLSSSDYDQIDHLIFFIHGVGGVCDVRFRTCVEVVADFRKMANNLLSQLSQPSSRASTPSDKNLQKHLKKGFFRKHSSESSTSRCSDISETQKSSSQIKGRKVECLPVSWHSCTRRQIGINEQLNSVALSSVPKIRHFLNKVVMDALLYTSGPVYCQTILNNVGDEINRLYTLFMEKHPNFNGSVSLAGHSLGSVIVFDLLANQIPPNIDEKSSKSAPSSNSVNNNNNNNNENEDENYTSNKRKNCRNISHHHHDFTSSADSCCTGYKNLEELLKDMDLTQYSDLFHKEHIDINTLLLLTDQDMKELKLPLGVRRKLGNYINFKKVSLLQKAVEAKQENTQDKEPPQQEEQNYQQSSTSESKTKCNHVFDDMNTGQYLIKYPQLKFKPKCFFAFGSPMPMFLNIRGIQEISKEYKLPTCDRMLNIYHPYDPLAYRVEPLIDHRFKDIEPVLVPHHRGGKRMHVQLREGFARVGYDIKHRIFGSIRDTWTNFTGFNAATPEPSPSPPPSVDSATTKRQKWVTKSSSSSVDVLVESFDSHQHFTDTITNQRKLLKRQPLVTSQSEFGLLGSNEFDSTKVGQLNGGRRVDYVLQEKPIELFNEYVFAFISHANYWQNEDSALILLNEIYSGDNLRFDNSD